MTVDDLILLAEARQAAKSGRGRRLREVAGLSQLEIAAAVGVSQAAVAKWEAGERAPHGDAAVRWAQVLGNIARWINAPESTPINDARPANRKPGAVTASASGGGGDASG